jgi:alkylated DNA repair dioxygenase AlkB
MAKGSIVRSVPLGSDDGAAVPGLTLAEDYVDVPSQHRLLATLDEMPWLSDLRRRVQHYGYRYDYRRRSATALDFLGPLPTWAQDLVSRLAVDLPGGGRPDQIIVNEYMPGQGISAHVDCVPCFGPVIASISLGSSCVVSFAEPRSSVPVPVVVRPGSLLVMTGPARFRWRHSIAARKSDEIDGVRVPRSRRVSLTFRTVVVRDGA